MAGQLLSGTVMLTKELRSRGIYFVESEPCADDAEADRMATNSIWYVIG